MDIKTHSLQQSVLTKVFARDSCELNDAEGPTSHHCHQDSRRGLCDAHGCCSDIQSRPSSPQLGVLVLADSRDHHRRDIHKGTGIKAWHWGPRGSSTREIVHCRCPRRNTGSSAEDTKILWRIICQCNVGDIGKSFLFFFFGAAPRRMILHTPPSGHHTEQWLPWLLTFSPLVCWWGFVHI